MGATTNIGWTNSTWNAVRGCERVSEGCKHCYAEVLAARHSYEGGWGHEIAEFVQRPNGKLEARWTGVIQTSARHLEAPLKWKDPRMIFVNSMSDLFHDRVPMDFIDKIFAVMAMSSRHTFQILTKRPERMLAYLTRKDITDRIGHAEFAIAGSGKRTSILVDSYAGPVHRGAAWPLPNVWLGVSAEDQEAADERIPLLLRTPAAVRWISAEPLLGSVELRDAPNDIGEPSFSYLERVDGEGPRIDWVVIGGESGSGHRPMEMENARRIIEQCKLSGTPVFVKQDSGPRPGTQGRFTDAEWVLKAYPK